VLDQAWSVVETIGNEEARPLVWPGNFLWRIDRLFKKTVTLKIRERGDKPNQFETLESLAKARKIFNSLVGESVHKTSHGLSSRCFE
jgi:hypothetical protein